jgi:hypothetical protein
MTEEEFSELSAKVLTNEATEEERSKHLSACEENSNYRETFEEMKSASHLLGENAPLAESMSTKDPEIPEFLLEQLVDEVNPQSTTTSDKDTSDSTTEENNTVSFWAKVAMPIAAVLAIAFYINQDSGEGGNSIAQNAPDEPYVVASLEVEFGRWNEQIVRGGDDKKDWVPETIGSAFYENKTERNEWLDNSSEKIRIWIDEDEAKIMIYLPNQKEASMIDLVLEPDKQKEQLVELMKSFSFPKNGVMYPVQAGDTLQSIAEELKSKPEWIEPANGLSGEGALEQGRELFIPQVD